MEVVCHADRGEVFPPFNAKYCCYFVYYVRISVLYIIKRNCDINKALQQSVKRS